MDNTQNIYNRLRYSIRCISQRKLQYASRVIVCGIVAFCLLVFHPVPWKETLEVYNPRMKPKMEMGTETCKNTENKENMSYGEILKCSHLNITLKKDLPDPFRLGGCQPYMNVMSSGHPSYLENFKNPCWYEELPSSSNLYLTDRILGIGGYKWIMKENEGIFKKNIQNGKLWRLRCLPYFYIIGFYKCASREIFHNIRKHPMVPDSSIKECRWWEMGRLHCSDAHSDWAFPIKDYIDIYDRPAMDVEKHKVHSNKWRNGYHPMILGDATAQALTRQLQWWNLPENKNREPYIDTPKYSAAHYIKSVTPNARFIITMRNPADRLYSRFHMGCNKCTSQDFHDNVVEEIKNVQRSIEQMSLPVYVSTENYTRLIFGESLYYPHLVKWLEVFPKEQIYFIKLEEVKQNKENIFNEIFKFLGLEPLAHEVISQESETIHIGNCSTCKNSPMLKKTRAILEDFFHPYNKMTADLLQDRKWMFD